jgi:hypothetical protein
VAPAYEDPRSRIVIDDAKSYFARGRNRYDIIVSEPSNPWVSGVASLFTEEFYARLAKYLNDGGVLSQWLHTYEIDGPTLASILKAMAKTFPDYAVYSTIDADIVIIARKGGPAGAFQGEVLEWPKMRERVQRLGLDRAALERRMIGSWSALEPLFATYGINANSDFFPVVDHRASKTRFTRERADMLTELQVSPVPLLEMLDPAPRGDRERGEAVKNTVVETMRQAAWVIHDVVVTGGAGPFDAQTASLAAPAFIVRQWALSCPETTSFGDVLPYMQAIAQNTNPHLPPAAASEIWAWIAHSPCGKRLKPAQRQWIDLFDSIGRRDPRSMVENGNAVLEHSGGPASPATEIAMLATSVGLVCEGRPKEVDDFLTRNARRFFRKDQREVELRYLLGLTELRMPAPMGSCTMASSAAATSGARRSP